MARITLSPIAASLSGRQGGITVRMTRNGPVMQKAQDTPAYDTEPALAQKTRFGQGSHAWGTMPATLRGLLTTAHTRASHGSPGPWSKAWTDYAQGLGWHYTYCTRPDKFVVFSHVTQLLGKWRLYPTEPFVHPWTSAWIYLSHPDGWTSPLSWRGPTGISTAFYSIAHEDIPEGTTALCLPKDRFYEDDVGIGDAIALPQPEP